MPGFLDSTPALHQTPALDVRVIAGRLGGRRLNAPRGLETRPTSDRVREALFMALEPLTGLRVVDLYAGSGALGIEALSRGAARADFVENDSRALAILRDNLKLLGLEAEAKVWRLTLPRGLDRLDEVLAGADLVLLDPPYGGGRAASVLEVLSAPGRLGRGARVVVEHNARDEMPERWGGLERQRQRRYGQTTVSTYAAGGDAPVSPPADI